MKNESINQHQKLCNNNENSNIPITVNTQIQNPNQDQNINNSDEDYSYSISKINKPNELKNFDTLNHIKKNIILYDKNCNEPITNYSYYCITCKKSICYKCGVYEHKEHILIQRDNCLQYDPTFFNEIAKVIEDGLLIEEKKVLVKNCVNNSINNIKEKLDNIRIEKFKEIDNIFTQIKANFMEVKNNYLQTKKTLENYYDYNKNFFNIDIKNIDTEEMKKNSEILENNNLNKSENNNNVKNPNEKIISNRDIENSIFLLNFDLMNLCDNKNIEILDSLNQIKQKINIIIHNVELNTKSFIEKINEYFDVNLNIKKFGDFYFDVRLRIQKISNHIHHFQETLYDIIKRTNGLEKIKDLLNILDSKNKGVNHSLFEQEFFKNSWDAFQNFGMKVRINTRKKSHSKGKNGNLTVSEINNTTNNTNISNNKIITRCETTNNICTTINYGKKTINKYNSKTKNSSKSRKLNYSTSPFDHSRTLNKNNNNTNYNTNYNIKILNNNNNQPIQVRNLRKVNSKKNINDLDKSNFEREKITLNQRLIQRFFAYSIYELYSKYYSICNNNSNKNIIINKNIKGTIAKRNSKNSFDEKNQNLPNTNFYKVQNKCIIQSASYLANYTNRYDLLKEAAKPLIGTNQIQIFDFNTKRISKKTLNLTKEEHGYLFFPHGCRHILIDNLLYITGGVDTCGIPINIVLEYNLNTNTILKLDNLIENHAYHSIEYIDNFDCLLIIGGQNTGTCEIMDMNNKIWKKLPDLNYPRANTNIYYNSLNGDLFCLFGMTGDMSGKNFKYSDVIEVLEMNNIICGWVKVDYYKSSGLDLKNKYCMTLPFTNDKLLIYGGESMRNEDRKLFALFNMSKNECTKVDTITMEQIKLEEKKITLVDLALSKLN